MNPFKYKQLKEFTIADCELYINKYPYGEHTFEVKRLLRELKKQKAEQPKVADGISNVHTEKPIEVKSKTIKSSNSKPKQTKDKDVAKTIFAWIGIIVVVLIVGTIIITILNEILPYNWWNRYRYIIYPAGLVLGRWLQKGFNW